MRHRLYSCSLIITIFFYYNYSEAQPPSIQWQKSLGGTQIDIGFSIVETTDEGFLVAGTTVSSDGDVSANHSTNHTDYWVVKLDSTGSIIWDKCYGSTSEDWLRSVIAAHDGGYILNGYASMADGDLTGLPMHGGYDYWVVKCDSLGSIQWSKNYGGTGTELSYKIINSLEGGYVVAGFAGSTDYDVTGIHNNLNCGLYPCYDGWLVKIDSLGNIEWSRCYGGSWRDQINSVFATSDSGYILAAYNRSDDGDATYAHGTTGTNANGDYWIVKINSVGNIEWQHSYGGFDTEEPYGIIETLDGGYLVTGSARSVDYDVDCNHQYLSTDAWTIKLDSAGNIQWKKCLGGTFDDEGYSIIQVGDSGYVILANVNSNDGDVSGNHGQSDMWLVKLNQYGDIEWQKCFGGTFQDLGYDMHRTSDNGLIICGASNSIDGDVTGNHGDWDMWVVKLSPLPAAIANNRNPVTDFTCHLNSTQEKLALQFFADSREKVDVTLLDITGRTVVQKDIETTPGLNKNEIRTGPLSNGIYLVRLETAQGSVTKKVGSQ